MDTSHVAFSDDSAGPDDRYKSLALLSLKAAKRDSFRSELVQILEKANISSEFKWADLRNYRYEQAASELIEFIFDHKGELRLDIIIWDLQDRRHDVFGRDDKENLARMYFHLVSNTFGTRWPVKNVVWNWFPDVQSSVDWDLLEQYIETKNRGTNKELFNENEGFENVTINDITPSDSEEKLLIQVADLFAGLGAYSRGRFQKYVEWLQTNQEMDSLFENYFEGSLSNSEKHRFKIMESLNRKCKSREMQISLRNDGGFRSYNPDSFLNFWFYKPQSDQDTAPKRS